MRFMSSSIWQARIALPRGGLSGSKHWVVANGRRLFDWSIGSLASFIAAAAHFTLLMRQEDEAADFVSAHGAALGISNIRIVEINVLTDGRATTAPLALDGVAESSPLVIYNIDTHNDPAPLPASAVRSYGYIPCLAAEGDAWSFVAPRPNRKVREKRRMSPMQRSASTFSVAARFTDRSTAQPMKGARRKEAGERYVSPMCTELIAQGDAAYVYMCR